MSCCSRYARITSGLSKYRSYADVLSSESEPASPPANARTRAESVVSSSCVCAGINGSFSPIKQNIKKYKAGCKKVKKTQRKKKRKRNILRVSEANKGGEKHARRRRSVSRICVSTSLIPTPGPPLREREGIMRRGRAGPAAFEVEATLEAG